MYMYVYHHVLYMQCGCVHIHTYHKGQLALWCWCQHSMASVGMMLELNQVQLECYTAIVSSLFNQLDCPKI